jgi:hypothetical protein
MANPFVTFRNVQSELHITQPGALNLLRGIERRGWLREMGAIGQGSCMVWVAPEILSVIADLPDAPRPPA